VGGAAIVDLKVAGFILSLSLALSRREREWLKKIRSCF
jgi:hypothetical protein